MKLWLEIGKGNYLISDIGIIPRHGYFDCTRSLLFGCEDELQVDK